METEPDNEIFSKEKRMYAKSRTPMNNSMLDERAARVRAIR